MNWSVGYNLKMYTSFTMTSMKCNVVVGDDVCMFQRFSMAKSAEPEPRENGLLLKPTANLTLRQYIVSEVDVSLQSAVGA